MATDMLEQSNTPWVERYRPKSLNEVSHQSEVIATLQNAVATGRLPHLLFYGPPGSGKTSVALALCRQLWHPSQWRRRVMELNASDERGISVVRDKIKHFASLTVGTTTNVATGAGSGGGGGQKSMKSFFAAKKSATKKDKNDNNTDNNNNNNESTEENESSSYPNPPFKVIILDEADTVTPDAQAALRRIIEAHSRITRFILICNYVTRIIEPLASRCAKFRFQSLPPESMMDRLSFINKSEQVNLSESQLTAILNLADGDMRRAVTTLQSVHALSGGSASDDQDDNAVTQDVLEGIAGVPPLYLLTDLWNTIETTMSFDKMKLQVEDLCAYGYSSKAVLNTMLDTLLSWEGLSEYSKARLAIRIAEAEKNMIDGGDEYLQLMTVCGLVLQCMQQEKKKKK